MVGVEAIIKAWQYIEPPDFGSGAKKNIEACVCALISFFNEYPPDSDPVQPVMTADGPAVEWSFALPIPGVRHPTTQAPMLYVGRFDMLAEMGGAIMVCDEKTASQLGISWAKNWKLASQLTGYCVIGETEVLTEYGWLEIKNLQENEKIAQWDNGKISFVTPSKIHCPEYKGKLVTINGKCELIATPDHNQLAYVRHIKGYKLFTLKDIPKNSGGVNFVSAGLRVDGYDLPEQFIRFLVAMQADGSWVHSADGKRQGARFGFNKIRKAERFTSILDELDIEYNHTTQNGGKRQQFYLPIGSEICKFAYEYLGPSKKFGNVFFSLSGETLQIFFDELRYWDGTDYGENKWMYFSTDESNVRKVQDLAALANLHVSVHWQDPVKGNKRHYRAVITKRIQHSVVLHTWGTVDYEGRVYCVTVPSSKFLVRYNRKVLVTGNCWAAKQFGYNVQGVVVRGIGILQDKITHQFIIEKRPQWMIDRWLEQLQRDTKRLIASWEEGYFDYTLDGACSYYGGCPYLPLCTSKDPEPWIEADYEIEVWDPLVKEK